jgi:mono/diheme cytochrome c family protein
VACHGDKGDGNGPAGAVLTPKPRDFTDAAFWGAKDEAAIKKVIAEGGAANGLSPLMAPWGPAIGDDGVANVYAYLEATFKPKTDPAAPAAE